MECLPQWSSNLLLVFVALVVAAAVVVAVVVVAKGRGGLMLCAPNECTTNIDS